jgi:hypothetical protein
LGRPAHLDRCSILGGCLVAEGWASGFKPELRHNGTKLDISVVRVDRPDLAKAFGARAMRWGFRLCAALPAVQGDLSLRLNAEHTVQDPGSAFAGPGQPGYAAMVERFRAAVQARGGRFLEIGSRARSGTRWRDALFPFQLDYVGLDIAEGENVDVVGDAHHLSRHVSGVFDFIFSVSVFEHLLMPWKAALEMNKVMGADALALIVSHPAWPLHEEPWDFFRFSTEAWRSLFNAHTGFELLDAQYHGPASIVPLYADSPTAATMYGARSFLLSGCLVKKVAAPKVAWEAEAAEVFDLAYAHG